MSARLLFLISKFDLSFSSIVIGSKPILQPTAGISTPANLFNILSYLPPPTIAPEKPSV